MKLPRLCSIFAVMLLAATLAASGTIAQPKPTAATPQALPEKLPATEFARLIREFSEEGGEFH